MAGVFTVLLLTILAVVVLVVLISCIKIVPQAQALVVERLGAYLGTWSRISTM